jgi:ABC-2 type transport system permease protein
MIVIAPLLLVGLIYFAFGGVGGGNAKPAPIQVGVLNYDRLPAGIPLEHPLGQDIRDMFFDESVAAWLTARDLEDETSARAAVDAQEIGAAVIIPPDFTERFLSGEAGAEVLILSDPSLTVAPQVVRNMVAALLNGVSGGKVALQTVMERQQSRGRQFDPSRSTALVEQYAAWYTAFERDMFHHPDRAALVMSAPAAGGAAEDPMRNMLGGMMTGQMVFFAFYTGAYSMMSILREKEEGTLARLFTTPVNRTTILAGKFLAVFLSLIVQGIVLIMAARFVFGVRWNDPLAAGLALTGQVIAAGGLGVLLISFVKTTQQGGLVLGGGLTALGMLGGLFTVGMSMPEAFTRLANFTPQGWVIAGWKIVLNGQPLADLALPLAVMAGMGLVMFLTGAMMFRRRFA